MTVPVECPVCHNKYAAPAVMLGKRVRCKTCGNAFTIGGDDALNELETGGSAAGVRGPGSSGAGMARPSAARTQSEPDSPFDLPEDPESAFSQAFSGFVAPHRDNTLYKFPNALLLDNWLPTTLVVIALLCIGFPTVDATLHVEPAWVGPLRLVLFAILYLGVICPIVRFSVVKAARKLKYDMPPKSRWRIAAAFSFPFAFACMLWLTTDSFGGFLPGIIGGLLLGLGAIWVLLRIRPEEAPITLSYSAGGFALGVLLSLGLLVGINRIAIEIVRTMKTPTTLAFSPIAPGLDWLPAPEPVGPLPQPANDTLAESPNSEHLTTQSTTQAVAAATAPSTTEPTGSQAYALSRQALLGSAGPLELPSASGSTQPASEQPDGGSPTAPSSSIKSNPSEPGTGSGRSSASTPDAFITAIRDAMSPAVASVNPVDVGTGLSGFIPAMNNAPWAILVHAAKRVAAENRGAAEKGSGDDASDAIEFWSLSPEPKRSFQRPPFRVEVDRNYVLSPSGELMARIVHFPYFGAEIWSTSKASVDKVIKFSEDRIGAIPIPIGFLSEDRLLLRWQTQRGSESIALEIYDVKTGKPQRPIQEPRHSHKAGNWAVSPDGRSFAMVAAKGDRLQDKPQVVVNAFSEAGSAKLSIPNLDAQWAADPLAIAFSPDGKRLAVIFEHDGDAAIYNWHLSDKKLTGPLLFPSGTLPAAVAPSTTDSPGAVIEGLPGQMRDMVWLSDSNTLLVRGDTVVDATSGRVITQLGAHDVLSSWVRGNQCLLLYRADKQLRLADVRLKKVDEAGAPAAPSR